MSFHPKATLGGGDQEHLQSWLLSQRAASLGWLCHPAQTHRKAETGAADQPVSAPELNPSAETSTEHHQHC